jgi:predicted dinucleotide-binding enzyme
MKIAVLGSGRMAEGVVARWLAAGHDVMIAGRTQAKAESLAGRLGARSGTLREAAEFGEVVFLAVLHGGVASTLRDAGAAEGVLAGKILIDCTNPFELERFIVVTASGMSVAEEIAEATGASVVKAFNQVHFHVWTEPARYNDRPLVVPVAGEPHAKEIVGQLIRDAGGDLLDAGGLEQAHNLEAMAAVMIRLLFGGADPLSAFQLTVGMATP